MYTSKKVMNALKSRKLKRIYGDKGDKIDKSKSMVAEAIQRKMK